MQQLNLQTMAEGESSLNIHEVASVRGVNNSFSRTEFSQEEKGGEQKVFQAEGVTLKLCRQEKKKKEKFGEEEEEEEQPQSGSRTSLGRK